MLCAAAAAAGHSMGLVAPRLCPAPHHDSPCVSIGPVEVLHALKPRVEPRAEHTRAGALVHRFVFVPDIHPQQAGDCGVLEMDL